MAAYYRGQFTYFGGQGKSMALIDGLAWTAIKIILFW